MSAPLATKVVPANPGDVPGPEPLGVIGVELTVIVMLHPLVHVVPLVAVVVVVTVPEESTAVLTEEVEVVVTLSHPTVHDGRFTNAPAFI